MSVERNGSEDVSRVNTPAVEVSDDDGTTWRPAKVTGWRGDRRPSEGREVRVAEVDRRNTQHLGKYR